MIAKYPINSVIHFLELIEKHCGGVTWVYRGQVRSAWALRPKAGRREHYLEQYDENAVRNGPSDDLSRFEKWREAAIALDRTLPEHYLECLAYAQHYGLATRLLDWTENPLVALFFAVEAEASHKAILSDETEAGCEAALGHEGAVFAYRNGAVEIGLSERTRSALEGINYVGLYRPRPIDRRIQAQSGVFTYHPIPKEPIKGSEINRPKGNPACEDNLHLVLFTANADVKHEIKRQLANIGFSRKTLFPDLEGLSEFINWGTEMRKNPDNENKRY